MPFVSLSPEYLPFLHSVTCFSSNQNVLSYAPVLAHAANTAWYTPCTLFWLRAVCCHLYSFSISASPVNLPWPLNPRLAALFYIIHRTLTLPLSWYTLYTNLLFCFSPIDSIQIIGNCLDYLYTFKFLQMWNILIHL